MKKSKKKIFSFEIVFYLSRLMLFIAALLPMSIQCDLLFNIGAIILIALAILSLFGLIGLYRKDRQRFIDIFLVDYKGHVVDASIAAIGVIVNYTIAASSTVFVWWLLLAVSIFEILFRSKS